MPYLEHNLGKTFYQSRGRAGNDGLPLVCLHGGPGGHSRFMTPLFKLADERRVFIYDQIGGGRSSPLKKRQQTIPTFVRELEQLVKAWGLDRFHLFGGSWGTTLALEYYLHSNNRQRVASLIFQSPLFSTRDWSRDADILIRGLPAEHRKVIRYCHEIQATDARVYQEAVKAYNARHVCRNKARTRRAATISNPHGNQVYDHMWGPSEFHATGTLKHYDRVNDLRQIACPTLLVCGEHDEARPATARRYSRLISGAMFAEVPGASHAILSERPARLLNLIRRFVRETDAV